MARRLRVTEAAQLDIDRINAWYSQLGAGQVAKQHLSRLRMALRSLLRAPCSFRLGPLPGTRISVSERHRILFRVSPDTGDNDTAGDVLILRIYGPGQAGD